MSHILLTQVKDGKEHPFVVLIARLDYSNQSSNSENQYINVSTSSGSTAMEVKESAVDIFNKINNQLYLSYTTEG